MRKIYSLLLTTLLTVCCGLSLSAQSQEGYSSVMTYSGTLTVDMTAVGGEAFTMDDQTLLIEANGNELYTITLQDFTFGLQEFGDIVVDNVAISISDTSVDFAGSKDGLVLCDGSIVANVACEGSLSLTTGLLEMKIDVVTTNLGPMNMQIPVTFAGYAVSDEPEQEAGYLGTLTIVVMDATTVVEDQTVSIISTGDDTCTFSLYNFSLNGMPLGDIVIENVAVSYDNDNVVYSGSKEGLSLAGGTITADVSCRGVEDAEGHLKMDISVVWMGIPIPVTFEGQRIAGGVVSVTRDDAAAPVEYFRLDGARADAGSLTPGLYIVRQGTKVRKAIVR